MLPALSPRGELQFGEAFDVLHGDTTTITAISNTTSPQTPNPAPIVSQQGTVQQPRNDKADAKKGRPRRRASAPNIGQCMPTIGLDDFELNFKLGEGGGGTVWQCTKRDTGQIFAIKIVEKSSIVS